mmetsp:Transcript_17495/g.57305  ORF Transcript_17495/g.57305 Transcript_17495/m.57305 type:complete len:282 (+) Transcript_17495:1646-2491(+)
MRHACSGGSGGPLSLCSRETSKAGVTTKACTRPSARSLAVAAGRASQQMVCKTGCRCGEVAQGRPPARPSAVRAVRRRSASAVQRHRIVTGPRDACEPEYNAPPGPDARESAPVPAARGARAPSGSTMRAVISYAARSSTCASIVPASAKPESSGRHPCAWILPNVSQRVYSSSKTIGAAGDGPSLPEARSCLSHRECIRLARYQPAHTSPHRASAPGDCTNESACSSSSGLSSAANELGLSSSRGEDGTTGAAASRWMRAWRRADSLVCDLASESSRPEI